MGKTLSALAILRILKARTTLIVCQVAGLGVWERAIHRWLPEYPLHIVRGMDVPKKPMGEGIYLTNYTQIAVTEPVWKLLLKVKPDFIVCDEAQTIKSPSARSGARIRILGRRNNSQKLLLSGTPAHNALDYWVPYQWIAPDVFPWSLPHGAYKDWLYIMGGPNANWPIKERPDRRMIAQEAALPYTHIAKVEERDWPEPIWAPLWVDLNDRERTAYREMRFTNWATIDGRTVAGELEITKLLRLQQISGGWVNDTDHLPIQVGDSKLQAALDIVRERAHQKVVIACAFIPEIEALALELHQSGYLVRQITGDTKPVDRTRYEDEFQKGDKPMVLLLQYKAGGTSITLTEAHALVLYSMLPSVISYRQMIGRVWREGQAKHVSIIPLFGVGTYDERLLGGLQQGLSDVDLYEYVMRRG
jgi:SNF2 family DNA or RNA helicase